MQLFFLASLGLFLAGLFLVLTRRNAIGVLMGVELMLNAANVNFVAFAQRFGDWDGQVVAIFVIVLAAAQASVALAIILNVFRSFGTAELEEVDELKG